MATAYGYAENGFDSLPLSPEFTITPSREKIMSEHAFMVNERRVFVAGEGVCIEVVPHPDGGPYLLMRTRGKESQEWFGALEVSVSKEFAILLAKALTDAAGEV